MNRDRIVKQDPPVVDGTGIPEIDDLTPSECKVILAEIFRFMYQNDDGTWDRDKEIPGTEMVSLLCAEMPELRPHVTQNRERKEP